MPGALFPRLKTWSPTEDVTAADLNAEFDNILNNLIPTLLDDYSANVAQMRTTTDPGEVGTESLATTLAGELERLRKIISEITGEAFWYETPTTNLASLATVIGGGLSPNRLLSGRIRSGSNQGIFLQPNGAARTATLKAGVTPFVYVVDSTQYTISSDVSITNLSLAPGAGNTCLVNDAGADDGTHTKHFGEFGTTLVVDTMGASIIGLTGQLAAFKINNGATDEYFIARVKSTTELTEVRRGYFFDSTDTPIARVFFADNDTITLMKLAWVFVTSSSTLAVTYTEPRVAKDAPLVPAIGDYWFDTENNTWKIYTGTFVAANATFLGVAVTDTANTIAARSAYFFNAATNVNTVELSKFDATEVRSSDHGDEVNVFGTEIRYDQDIARWDMDTNLDTGIAEAANTEYYFYLTEDGESVISDVCPFDARGELSGLYHPFQTWRCVGHAFNGPTSNFDALVSYHSTGNDNFVATSEVAASALTVRVHAPPHKSFLIKSNTLNDPQPAKATVLPGMKLTVSSGSTLGTANGVNADLIVHGIVFAGRFSTAISQAPHLEGSIATSTAEGGAGAADAGEVLYSKTVRTGAVKIFAKLLSNQATAGTWATAISEYTNYPFTHIFEQTFISSGTLIVPSGHRQLDSLGSGGGGGGGGGAARGAATCSGGGGGGAGALYRTKSTVVPLDTLTITLGAGGAGGGAGSGGNQSGVGGSNGGDTTITGTNLKLHFLGGGGGGGGPNNSTPTVNASVGNGAFGAGGDGLGSGGGSLGSGGNMTQSPFGNGDPGRYGGGGAAGQRGGTNRNGGAGGASVVESSVSSGGSGAASVAGGSGGGGGGTGFLVGGNGGATVAGGTGAAGSAAAANSAAGGGGGAGSDGAGANGGAGAAGGSSKIIIYWRTE